MSTAGSAPGRKKFRFQLQGEIVSRTHVFPLRQEIRTICADGLPGRKKGSSGFSTPGPPPFPYGGTALRLHFIAAAQVGAFLALRPVCTTGLPGLAEKPGRRLFFCNPLRSKLSCLNMTNDLCCFLFVIFSYLIYIRFMGTSKNWKTWLKQCCSTAKSRLARI